MNPETIREFWFGGADPMASDLEERIDLWFAAPPEADNEIEKRFGEAVIAALDGELDTWKDNPADRLSLIILLDQFTRNIYRGTPYAFSGDEQALALALECVDNADDRDLSIIERAFVYMPLQHAEANDVQARSVCEFEGLVHETDGELRKQMLRFLASAKTHRDIIERFGRFPHRNAILDRDCTEEEMDYLKRPGAPFRAKS